MQSLKTIPPNSIKRWRKDMDNKCSKDKILRIVERITQTINQINNFPENREKWADNIYVYGLARAQIHQLREDYLEAYITPDYQQLCRKKLYPPRHNAAIHYTLVDKTPLGQDKPLILVAHACLQETLTALLQEYSRWRQVYDPQGTPQQYIQRLRKAWLNNNTLAPITPAKTKHIQKLAPRLHKAITAGIQAARQATAPNTALWTWNTLEPTCIYTVIDTTNLTPDQAANKTKQALEDTPKIQQTLAKHHKTPPQNPCKTRKHTIGPWTIATW